MATNGSHSAKISLVLLIFIVSLTPITIETGMHNVYINYLYAFLLFLPFTRYRFGNTGPLLVLIYTTIFVAGFFKLLHNDSYYFTRVTLSFIVFITPFLMTFVKIDDSYFEKFKQAIILVSIFYSLMLVYQVASIGYQGDFHGTKDQMGTNRYGFVIILAFFILLYENYGTVLKVILLTLLIVGLTLTFSRASIVAFGAAAAILVAINIRKINVKYLLGGLVFGVCLFFVFRQTIIGQIVDFFAQYLLSYDKYNLTWSKSSEGLRVYLFNQIISYVKEHPLFGSNYAGLYLLYDEYKDVGASAHNQYTDVLLRTGIIGLLTLIFILFRIAKYYFRNDPGVFFGLIGILVYGLFHETFKLAHGSFIFAMLLSYYLYKKEPDHKLVISKFNNQATA